MAFTLTLSANSSILSSEFFPPIDLKNLEYVCGLIDLQTYNSIPNIDEDNNLFIFEEISIPYTMKSLSADVENSTIDKIAHHFTIPTGSYEIVDIEKFIQKQKWFTSTGNDDDDVNEGDAGENEEEKFYLRANNNTLKCELFSRYKQINFTEEGTIGALLGFSNRILEPNKWHESDLYVDINKVSIVRVECNIIGGTYINGEEAHILHEFSIGVSPGYKIIEVPHNVIYLPVNVKQISSLTIKLVDQNGDLINFRGETITIRLHLKPQQHNDNL